MIQELKAQTYDLILERDNLKIRILEINNEIQKLIDKINTIIWEENKSNLSVDRQTPQDAFGKANTKE